MEIAIRVAGFSAAESDGFRRAMGTWRSSDEMEKLHARFVDGCMRVSGLDHAQAEELYRQVAAFASFGFNKSHAAAFARTAYESAFLKLFYPAQFVVGLINAQPMGFYPVEVLVNDARRHGVAVLPVDVNRSRWRTMTEWIGLPGDGAMSSGGEPGALVDDRSCPISEGAIRTTERAPASARPASAESESEPFHRSLRSALHEEPRDRRRDRSQRFPSGTRGPERPEPGERPEPVEWPESVERPVAVDSPACVVPTEEETAGMVAASAGGFAIRLGLHLVKGIGEEHQELLDREFAAGPYRSLADVVERTGLPEETIERLIRAGALDSLGPPRRELLWQLREVMGVAQRRGRGVQAGRSGAAGEAVGAKRLPEPTAAREARQVPLHLPATDAPDLPLPTDLESLADSYAVLSLDARRQVIELFRPALGGLGAVTIGELSSRRPGRVRIGGLVVTRQHPMTAKGTVFLALEDETGMANVTLWPDAWARLRSVVRRHALLLIDGTLQRESNVVNIVARNVRPLVDASTRAGGPGQPDGVRHMGHAGMRRQ
jgi:error-prone DNA polymerase